MTIINANKKIQPNQRSSYLWSRNPYEINKVATEIRAQNVTRNVQPKGPIGIYDPLNMFADLLILNQYVLTHVSSWTVESIENIINPTKDAYEKAEWKHEYADIWEYIQNIFGEGGWMNEIHGWEQSHQNILVDLPEFKEGKAWYEDVYKKSQDLNMATNEAKHDVDYEYK